MSSVWDDPTLKVGGEYIKFENVGDTAIGDVVAVGIHQFDDGSRVPSLSIVGEDGEQRTLNAGQIRLKIELAEKRPEVGDRIKIVFTEVEKRAGNRTLKHFDVTVKKGGGTAVARSAVVIEDEIPF